jgi:hypothetical protein
LGVLDGVSQATTTWNYVCMHAMWQESGGHGCGCDSGSCAIECATCFFQIPCQLSPAPAGQVHATRRIFAHPCMVLRVAADVDKFRLNVCTCVSGPQLHAPVVRCLDSGAQQALHMLLAVWWARTACPALHAPWCRRDVCRFWGRVWNAVCAGLSDCALFARHRTQLACKVQCVVPRHSRALRVCFQGTGMDAHAAVRYVARFDQHCDATCTLRSAYGACFVHGTVGVLCWYVCVFSALSFLCSGLQQMLPRCLGWVPELCVVKSTRPHV